jgi:hypothetical protein
MWTKPKSWGGYDTAKGKFYLQTKDGFYITETSTVWDEAYELWLSGKSKWSLFGYKEKLI